MASKESPLVKAIAYFFVAIYSRKRFLLFLGLLIFIIAPISQYLITLPQLSESHPYSDALIYLDMANGELNYWGPTHITHRIILPFIVGLIASISSISAELLFFVINGAALLLLFYIIHKMKGAISLLYFMLMLIGFSSFWRGYYLPMVDSLSFVFLTLMWLLVEKGKWIPFLIIVSILVGIKEINLLLIVFLLFDKRRSIQFSSIVVLIIGIFWVLIDLHFSGHMHYLFQPKSWLSDWASNINIDLLWLPKYLLSAFGFLVIIWFYRFYTDGIAYIREILPEIILFSIIILFTPSNSPRILFPFTGILLLRNLPLRYRIKF